MLNDPPTNGLWLDAELESKGVNLDYLFYCESADRARRCRPRPARAQGAHVQEGGLLAWLPCAEMCQQGVDTGVLVREEREVADQAVLCTRVDGLVLKIHCVNHRAGVFQAVGERVLNQQQLAGLYIGGEEEAPPPAPALRPTHLHWAKKLRHVRLALLVGGEGQQVRSAGTLLDCRCRLPELLGARQAGLRGTLQLQAVTVTATARCAATRPGRDASHRDAPKIRLRAFYADADVRRRGCATRMCCDAAAAAPGGASAGVPGHGLAAGRSSRADHRIIGAAPDAAAAVRPRGLSAQRPSRQLPPWPTPGP